MEAEKKTSLPWLWIIAGIAVVGYIVIRVLMSRSSMLSNMEKVREAKAAKAALADLLANEPESDESNSEN